MSAAEAAPLDPKVAFERSFALAFHMPVGWNRITAQKNALVSLSQFDPQRAMDLFLRVENPQPFPGLADLPEDVRADGATHIFPNYWHLIGRRGIQQIGMVAKHIGDTGEYPYSAVGWILQQTSNYELDTAKISALFEEAVSYYRQPSRFLNRNEEFLKLLEAVKAAVGDSQFKPALHMFATRLTAEQSRDGHFVGEIKTSSVTIQFTDENRFLLFKVLPLIFEKDPQWAKTLMQKDPVLGHAREEVVYAVSGVVRGNSSGIRLLEYQEDVFRRALAKEWHKLRRSNPAAAWELGNRLSNEPRLLAVASFSNQRK